MKHLTAILAAAALAGCATTNPAQLDEARRTVPTCTAGADCAAKWDAAQLWIVQRAGFKLQTSTGVVLQTYGPSTAMQDSTRLAVTVTREPDGPQRFRIVPRIGCGNPFGCTPEVVPALLDFNRTVSAAGVQQ
ncbi:MAG TPA: hypothetical protein VN680_19280 [Burkholderiaceae bacterium]|nr:hypothetical protein [Burkholderiaceae bacterium]